MTKINLKNSATLLLVLIATTLFANKTPNYPKGFRPKTNNGVVFTENKGQVHDQHYKSRPDVLFSGTDGNLTFHLKNNGISYQLSRVDTWKKESDLIQHHDDVKIQKADEKLVADKTTIYRLDVNWLNTNTNAQVTKHNPLEGFNNYYLESCPDGALNVKSYQQILYQNIYNGIDLKWYQKDGHLEYDYIVSAGADYKKIQFEINGAEKITINKKGDLIFKTPLGDIMEQAPIVKQNGKLLKSKWVLTNNVLSFDIQHINNTQPFIIDPVVRAWGTYYGDFGDETGASCAIDATSNVYMAGGTNTSLGTTIATLGSHQSAFSGGSGDAFLVKFNSSGVRQWGTYYGGSGGVSPGGIGGTGGYSCITDGTGNVYMAGITSSTVTAISTIGSHQSAFGGGYYDAFLVKFNSAGVRQWGTYYGGSGDDRGYLCSTDAIGNIYLAGTTTSSLTAIATLGSHQSNYGGSRDVFLVKFSSSGVRQWGTYYGGSGYDGGSYLAHPSCATDVTGNIYLAGSTTSSLTAISTVGSHQSAFGGGNYDAFLVKFNSAGVRQWGTYYGDASNDLGYFCTTDATGNVYLTGDTDGSSGTGSSFGTPGCHQSNFGGDDDAFLVKFNGAGIRQWGTLYGGDGYTEGHSCITDSIGNVYLVGTTISTTGTSIATLGSLQPTNGGGRDAFLVKFNGTGIRQWGTYFGGYEYDEGWSCAIDGPGNVFMAGSSRTPYGVSIASLGSHQSAFGGGYTDAFLVKFNDNAFTGINEVSSNSISIYPNPNHGLFTIELNETTQVMITNVFGQVILMEKVMAGKQTLDIKNHANGIYFVKLIKDGKQQTIKLIKE